MSKPTYDNRESLYAELIAARLNEMSGASSEKVSHDLDLTENLIKECSWTSTQTKESEDLLSKLRDFNEDKDHKDKDLKDKDHMDKDLKDKDQMDKDLKDKDHTDKDLKDKDQMDKDLKDKDHKDKDLKDKDQMDKDLKDKDDLDKDYNNDHKDKDLKDKQEEDRKESKQKVGTTKEDTTKEDTHDTYNLDNGKEVTASNGQQQTANAENSHSLVILIVVPTVISIAVSGLAAAIIFIKNKQQQTQVIKA